MRHGGRTPSHRRFFYTVDSLFKKNAGFQRVVLEKKSSKAKVKLTHFRSFEEKKKNLQKINWSMYEYESAIETKVNCQSIRRSKDEKVELFNLQNLLITGGTNASERRSRFALRVCDGRKLTMLLFAPASDDVTF